MKPTRRARVRRLVVAVVAVAFGAVGCASDDGSESSPSSSSVLESGVETTGAAIAPSSIDEELLGELVDAVVFPGDQGSAMVAVASAEGSIVYASRGSDPQGDSPVPESLFRVGSITKVFTSLLVLSLIDDGTVELNAPATDYVTRVAVPEGVTVRDLLQHTSGVPNYTDVGGFLDDVFSDPERAWSPEETMAVLGDSEPQYEPGERFSYSNTNYLILGVLIEETTGRSYAEELRARIIEPLRLENTYLAGFEDGTVPFGAYASTSFGGPSEAIDFDYTSIATNAWAAGAVVSSVEDLHLLLGALFDGEIITPGSLAAMTENAEYGLGLAQIGSGLHGHAGSIPGYQTYVVHASQTGTTAFFVVTNDSVRTPPNADPVLERIRED